MNRGDLQVLADVRIDEARALLTLEAVFFNSL